MYIYIYIYILFLSCHPTIKDIPTVPFHFAVDVFFTSQLKYRKWLWQLYNAAVLISLKISLTLKTGNRECSSSHFLHFCVSWVSRRLPQLYDVETSIPTNVLVKLSTVENRIALKLSLIETVTSYSQRVMTDSQIEGGVFASDVHSCQVKFLSCGETYDLKTWKLKYTYTEKTCDKRRY